MRLSCTDLVPVLAIVAGGAIGASLSFGLLGSRSEDAPGVTLGLLYESSAPTESAPVRPVPASPEGAITCISNDTVYRIDRVRGDSDPVEFSLEQWRIAYGNEPLMCIAGADVEMSFFETMDPDAVESIEVLKADVAVPLYGARASAGVIRITLKEIEDGLQALEFRIREELQEPRGP